MHLMDESMLVPYVVSRRPPCVNIWVRGISGQYCPVPLQTFGIVTRIELQFVHPLQVEDHAAFAAIDLEAGEILPPGGEPCGLE